jgi:hypothetical protein
VRAREDMHVAAKCDHDVGPSSRSWRQSGRIFPSRRILPQGQPMTSAHAARCY